MKTKTWHVVTTSAKHWTHQQHVYQQSLASLTSIRPHLSTTTKEDNNNNNNNKLNNTPIIITNNKTFYPIYKQPKSINCRSFSTTTTTTTSRSVQPTTTRSLQTAATASPVTFQLPNTEQQHSLVHHNNKSLPLLDFFSKSYAKPVPSYTFTHGASGFAKNRHRYTTPDNKLLNNENYYSIQIGEDAYFRRSDSLGIADGVGGFADTAGSSSAFYSRQLMHYAYVEMERFNDTEDPCFFHYDDANPISILKRSYENTLRVAKQNNILGATTACIAVLRHDELRVANIGDCGISVIRHNGYIFRSEEQQHSFNFPYQLGATSPDRPNDAQSFTVSIEKGDIIIMGSDGLYDNLFDKEILSIVKAQVAHSSSNSKRRFLSIEPQKISDALAERAKYVSKCKLNVDSPFQVRAVNEGLYYQGGKADDISVIVAIVNDCEDSPNRRL